MQGALDAHSCCSRIPPNAALLQCESWSNHNRCCIQHGPRLRAKCGLVLVLVLDRPLQGTHHTQHPLWIQHGADACWNGHHVQHGFRAASLGHVHAVPAPGLVLDVACWLAPASLGEFDSLAYHTRYIFLGCWRANCSGVLRGVGVRGDKGRNLRCHSALLLDPAEKDSTCHTFTGACFHK